MLTIHVLAGRHIFGLGKTYQGLNTSNVDYAIEIIGVDVDKAKHRFKVRKSFKYIFDNSAAKTAFYLAFLFLQNNKLA